MDPLSVQHCILAVVAATTRPGALTGGEVEFALRGIGYQYRVPANTEFGEHGCDARFGPPGDRRRQVSVFLRLIGRSAGPTQVLIRSHYRYDQDCWREMQQHFVAQVLDFPSDAEVVFDVSYNLPYLRIGGIGLHAITVHFRPVPTADEPETDDLFAWRSEDEWESFPGWSHGATEYFEIVGGA